MDENEYIECIVKMLKRIGIEKIKLAYYYIQRLFL